MFYDVLEIGEDRRIIKVEQSIIRGEVMILLLLCPVRTCEGMSGGILGSSSDEIEGEKVLKYFHEVLILIYFNEKFCSFE